MATNAAFKGLLGSMGESGHICASTIPIQVKLDLSKGWEQIRGELAKAVAGELQDGDVLVVAEKVVAASQGRVGPREVLLMPDPKTVSPDELPSLAERWQDKLGMPIQPIHLLLADEYENNQATLGVLDHNQACFELAAAIKQENNKIVDVVISDTDTGLDIRMPLIGCVTICATPIGATAGLVLYEAMRCAVAAEFIRGHGKFIPAVICRPADRRKARHKMGLCRDYGGSLHISREKSLAHA